jgi:hypothetical protein
MNQASESKECAWVWSGHSTVKNWYKNVINQKSGDSWLASHVVHCDLSQPCVKDTSMIPKWLITRCWNARWWNSNVHDNNVNSVGRKHSSIATDGHLKRQTHLAVWLCTPLLSSLCPMHLSGHQVEMLYHFRQTWRQNQRFLFTN